LRLVTPVCRRREALFAPRYPSQYPGVYHCQTPLRYPGRYTLLYIPLRYPGRYTPLYTPGRHIHHCTPIQGGIYTTVHPSREACRYLPTQGGMPVPTHTGRLYPEVYHQGGYTLRFTTREAMLVYTPGRLCWSIHHGREGGWEQGPAHSWHPPVSLLGKVSYVTDSHISHSYEGIRRLYGKGTVHTFTTRFTGRRWKRWVIPILGYPRVRPVLRAKPVYSWAKSAHSWFGTVLTVLGKQAHIQGVNGQFWQQSHSVQGREKVCFMRNSTLQAPCDGV